MNSSFFAHRPVFAWVIALGILLAGIIALRSLPIEQYPTVAPPSLTLSLTYPGADAATLDQNVTSVIEKEMNGVPGFLYMEATSRSNGTAQIAVTFESGTDINIAQMEVQNRLSRVEPRLPEEVRRQGVQVNAANSGFLMLVALTSKSGATSTLELGDFASNKVVDELRRVSGVGDVRLFGTEYAMRIWLDPQKLAGYDLSAAEVLAAVQEQNSQTAGGSLGDQPIAKDSQLNATVITQNRFTTPEEFRQIILRANADGSTIHLGDVARVELGADSYLTGSTLNGKTMAGMGIQLTSGANALSTAQGVRARLDELSRTFPEDIAWTTPYDTTPFISASVEEVIKTLAEAMALVFVVMFLFLQNWRATLIPTIVVPVALAGACFGLLIFGYSINILSLFGMVVAIGILVDDAIVVVENVERIMAEEGLPPREATVKAMGQITSAIIGITLVLMTVFLPMAFFPGTSGGIYRQFSVTLAISIGFSALLALSLTPALCATLLKPHRAHSDSEAKPRNAALAFVDRFLGGFNRGFNRMADRYQAGVGRMLTTPLRWLAVFLVAVLLTGLLYTRLPGGFLPSEDQGVLLVTIDAPPGATAERTQLAIDQTRAFFKEQPEVANIVMISGFNFFGQGQNAAMGFISLRPWSERAGAAHSADALSGRAMAALSQVKTANIFALNPPPIPALGTSSGFSMKIQNRSGADAEALIAARDQVLAEAAKSPLLVGVRAEGQPDAPQLYLDIDRVRARALGVNIGDINATLSIALASSYANDFTYGGNISRVLIQASAEQRMTPADILNLQVRNAGGQMVPFSAFSSTSWTAGAPQLQRYNGYPALTVSGAAAPGRSSGAALDEMEAIADRILPTGFGYEWTGIAFEERQAGAQVVLLLAISLLIVFLVLAALYESWPIPLSVLLGVPIGVLGAVVFTLLRGLSADIYFNVGLITIIGLSAKNAILIVEFAIEQEEAGKSTSEAILQAARLRLRPIVMTSLAFVLGMVPLFIATGAGAASRQAVGTGVIGGMIAVTLLGVFLTPVFYLSARRWLSRGKRLGSEEAPHA
ncbi:multidrug transporter [Phenylobacterium sp. Root77]|jgi:multidrug efflux pump|uniref:efflux RND transporter permease subunit n=1 Tax=unclassified Phenylobacterium TaxID=2640670 RepID=UPI0006FFCC52|nr:MULTISPECIES: efflux RND transporter permease subunit [unclassified Phenylobacterium]KQW68161.1 multidrug transporter [Phenylobacterium sp. Root1277]KQW91904.1 multidrug transporter [Phenylobacterium sp. Root1290]KRC40135.1 multidrug transporter [Phenylobacterium sp. Root77]